ncbi:MULTISPECIES: hypothetical protein [Yersinia]|uniref:hypothetical protein n=1 Tax=Yersinia TaxID=629 RepID=UPI0005E73631|nr:MULTISPECIES: hypothetical protein [Yersinia]CNI90138.1 Uncharacterised protein [Yersinia intermedia]CNL74865.1 Uncharacterised protein [Yersinia kristensenii]
MKIQIGPDGKTSVQQPISAFEISELGKVRDTSRTEGDVTIREVEFEDGGKVFLSVNNLENKFSYKAENVISEFVSNKDEPETVTLIIKMKDE